MYRPIFTITPKLITYLTKIERFYGHLEALRVPKKLQLNLERDNLIESAYASNKIEGNPLSLRDVTNLLLDARVPVNRDEKEVTNYFTILKNLEKYKNIPINLDLILDLHKSLMQDVDNVIAGQVRNDKVVVGRYAKEGEGASLRVKHDPPFHKRNEIGNALNEVIIWLEKEKEISPIIKAGLFHHEFVYIHPFDDGNGRICRILTTLIFLINEYEINKYFILDDYYDIDRIQYSDMLHSADEGNKTKWLEYFTEGVKYSLQSAISKMKNAMDTLRIEDKPTPKEQEVLKIFSQKQEVTSHDIAQKLHVSRQQAHSLLKSLLNRGIIDKKGSTKSSYYFIK